MRGLDIDMIDLVEVLCSIPEKGICVVVAEETAHC